jgi:hypothetical protein
LYLNIAIILIPTLFCYSMKMPSIFYILVNAPNDLYHSSAEDCKRQAIPYFLKTLIKPRTSKMLFTQAFNNHTSLFTNRRTCITNSGDTHNKAILPLSNSSYHIAAIFSLCKHSPSSNQSQLTFSHLSLSLAKPTTSANEPMADWAGR